MSKNRGVLKSVAVVTLISVITRSVSFAFKIYLSRKIGAELLGLYQTALSVFGLLIAFTAGGLNTVVSRKISEMRALNGSERGSGAVTDALKIGLTASVLCVAAVYAFSPLLEYAVADTRAIPLIKIMLPALVTTTLYIVLRGWFWGNRLFAEFGLTELIEEVLRILFTLLFVYGAFTSATGEAGLAFAFTLSDAVVAVLLIILFIVKGGRLRVSHGAAEMLCHSAPITATRVFSALAGTAVALILPAKLIENGVNVSEATAAIGRISGMANPLLFAPNAVIGSLAVVLVPEMSANHARGDYEGLNKNLASGITFASAVSVLFVSAYLALGEQITSFLYDDTASGLYLMRSAALMLPMSINGILVSALNGIGMEKESFLTYILGTIPMVAIIWLTTKNLGVYSVVLGEAVCLAISSIANIILLHKRAKIGFGYLKNVFKIALSAIPCYFSAKWTSGALGENGFLALCLSGLITLIVYALSLYLTGIADGADIGKILKEKSPKRKNPLHTS